MTTSRKSRRRTVSKATSQEDLISQFESGEGVSKKSQQMLNGLKERDKSKESDVHDDPLFKTASELDRVLMDYIQPQPDNSRYLPVKFAKKADDESIDWNPYVESSQQDEEPITGDRVQQLD